MSYAEIDPIIAEWAQRNLLSLHTSWAGGEIRSAYVSSIAGDCYQISIDKPVNDRVTVLAGGVEGPADLDISKEWTVAIAELSMTLDKVLATVIAWMAPSVRHFPSQP